MVVTVHKVIRDLSTSRNSSMGRVEALYVSAVAEGCWQRTYRKGNQYLWVDNALAFDSKRYADLFVARRMGSYGLRVVSADSVGAVECRSVLPVWDARWSWPKYMHALDAADVTPLQFLMTDVWVTRSGLHKKKEWEELWRHQKHPPSGTVVCERLRVQRGQ